MVEGLGRVLARLRAGCGLKVRDTWLEVGVGSRAPWTSLCIYVCMFMGTMDTYL